MTAASGAPATRTGPPIPRWWWPVAALSLAIAAYSLRYVAFGARAYVPELSASFLARPALVAVHTGFGPVALVLGLANFLPALRTRTRWPMHRLVGRVYVGAVLVLGSAGLVMSLHAAGGTVARAGFFILALLTVGSALAALRAILAGNVRAHREWMLRTHACIFGAVTLRLWLPLLIMLHAGEFLPAYRWVAWLSWVPNVLWAEWVIHRGWQPRFDR